MTQDARHTSDPIDPFALVDPWVALDDGRRQLLAALDACDARTGARTLKIPEFAALGESSGTLSALLLAHAERDRAHAAFFISLDTTEAHDRSTPAPAVRPHVDADAWSAVRAEVIEARAAMLEALAALASEHWEGPLQPPWPGAGSDSLAALLLVRAMCDGILADTVRSLLAPATGP